MKSQKYTCSYCLKDYSRKIYYDRHVICCNLTAMANINDKRTLEEMNDTPSTRELYFIIQELVKKQNKMEEELKSLRKYTNKVKRNIDVIEWLNSNVSPCEFCSWRDFIEVKRDELEYSLQNGMVDGIFNILKNNLSSETEYPIKSFEHKVNSLYVYQENTWSVMESKDFKKLIQIITKKIMKAFNEWTTEKTISDELKRYPYHEYVIKISSNTFKESEIKTQLYDYLKICIKNINQIEM